MAINDLPSKQRATPGPPSNDVARRQHVLDEAKAIIGKHAIYSSATMHPDSNMSHKVT